MATTHDPVIAVVDLHRLCFYLLMPTAVSATPPPVENAGLSVSTAASSTATASLLELEWGRGSSSTSSSTRTLTHPADRFGSKTITVSNRNRSSIHIHESSSSTTTLTHPADRFGSHTITVSDRTNIDSPNTGVSTASKGGGQGGKSHRELPAAAVATLKAWLFSAEHFTHPYPTTQSEMASGGSLNRRICQHCQINIHTNTTAYNTISLYIKDMIPTNNVNTTSHCTNYSNPAP